MFYPKPVHVKLWLIVTNAGKCSLISWTIIQLLKMELEKCFKDDNSTHRMAITAQPALSYTFL
jgi:hypothetical protein